MYLSEIIKRMEQNHEISEDKRDLVFRDFQIFKNNELMILDDNVRLRELDVQSKNVIAEHYAFERIVDKYKL